jgi:glycosyltransferase involved in cell wall biosynthesis
MLASALAYARVTPGVRTVFTFHTEPVDHLSGTKKKIFEWMLSKCDAVTFVSESLREKITAYLDISASQKVVYAGVSELQVDREAKDSFRKEHGLLENSPLICFVGDLVWEGKVEGVKRLLLSMRYLMSKLPRAKLIVVGKGHYLGDLERLTKEEDLEKDIIFTGSLDEPSIAVAASDIYAHISLQEGLPFAVLEAMSLGKPIVAADVGGIPEAIEDGVTGVLVPPDPKSVAEEIQAMYDDKDKMEMLGANARKRAKDKFDWERCADDYGSIYRGDT